VQPAPEANPGRPLCALSVCCDGAAPHLRRRAEELAASLGSPLTPEAGPGEGLRLTVTQERLELRCAGPEAPGPVFVDFLGGALGYARRVNRFGLMYKALGVHLGVTTVVDATAGLGRDAFLLAIHGFQVVAVERCPVLVALIEDGLARVARQDAELSRVLGARLTLVRGDARDYLRSLPAHRRPEAVYLDPMYPPKKKTALVRKELRIIRLLVGNDEDADSLFDAAMGAATRRLVVKRMRHAPPLAAGLSRSLADRTTRYDVYEAGIRRLR